MMNFKSRFVFFVTIIVMCVVGLIGINAIAQEGTLKLAAWSHKPHIVEDALKRFEEMYGIPVDFYPMPSTEYADRLLLSFMGGTEFDVVFVRQEFGIWADAGWLMPLDDFPETKDIKESLPQQIVEQMSYNGKLYGTPYFTSPRIFLYNTEHLKKIGIDDLPLVWTWEDLIEISRKLMESGIVEHPFFGHIGTNHYMRTWIEGVDYSRGGKRWFDEEGRPTFLDDDSTLRDTLIMIKEMIDEGIIAPGSLTADGKDPVLMLASGEATFIIGAEYNLIELTDPEFSKEYNNIKMACSPGPKQGVIDVCHYSITSNCKQKEKAWELVKYLGWKDKTGNYYMSKKWAIEGGLGFPYNELFDDDEVMAAIGRYTIPEVMQRNYEEGVVRVYQSLNFFSEWEKETWSRFQDAVTGKRDIDIVLKELYDLAIELKGIH